MRSIQRVKAGFTLIEVMVVITVAALLLAVLIPAVMQARASARTASCKSNLRQIGLATHAYIDVHRYFPGGLYRSQGPLYDLLSYIEQEPIYRRAEEATTDNARSALIPVIPVYLCPDDPTDRTQNVASYLVNQGLLPALGGEVKGFVYEPVTPRHVKDGLSSTAFFSESISNDWRPIFTLLENPVPLKRTRDELTVLSSRCLDAKQFTLPNRLGGFSPSVTSSLVGYNHLLPPNTPACSYSPYPLTVNSSVGGHSGGVNALIADGAVRFVNENIDRDVWWNVGTIDGGEQNANW
jgi:prepilin-type N-terminal cleavage/methylation domain-containing protein